MSLDAKASRQLYWIPDMSWKTNTAGSKDQEKEQVALKSVQPVEENYDYDEK